MDVEGNRPFLILKKKIDWIKVGTLLSVVSALIMALFAYLQLKEFNNATKADFAHKFKSDFFTDNSCILMALFDYDLLKFEILPNFKKPDEFGYFVIRALKMIIKNSILYI